MAKKYHKKTNKNNIKKDHDLGWYYMIPLMFIVAIIPLITFAKVIMVEGAEMANWKGGEQSIDFFSYYKSIWFSVTAFIAFGLTLLLRLTGQYKFKKSKYYIPLLIYIVFVVLSYILSDYEIVARRGFVELFQGVWVMVGYGLVVFAGINCIQNEKHVKLLLGSYIFVGLVTAFIGIGQYFGHDLFKSEFGRYLILPENMHQIAETLKFNFGEKTIYATMYNTNFVGSFAAILLSLSVALFIYAKGIKQISLSGIFLGLMVAVWIGSRSRAGMVGFALGLVFIVLLFRKNLKDNIKKLVGLVLTAFAVIIVLNIASDGAVIKEFKSLSIFREANRLEDTSSRTVRIEDIAFDGYSVNMVTENESFRVFLDGEEMKFEDTEGNLLEINEEDGKVFFVDERYANHSITMNTNKGRFTVKLYNQRFMIYFTKDGFKMLGSGGVLSTTDYPDRLEFMDGYEKFASSRGYIWSRSVPMLKDTFFIGNGPGTYAIKFPQKDYVGKMNGFDNEAMIVDKPHNMYIQIGANTGLISLLALLSVYFMYFVDSMKLYWKRDIVSFLDHIGLGIVTAMISYLGAGFFNDQIISVAPIFYVLIGMGIAVNALVKKQIVGD